MCLLIVGHRIHPSHPLIIAANRDEAYRRPAAAAHWWEDARGVLAGRDLTEGGTWLGVTASGRFAALTNYWESEPPHKNPPSRGALVRNYLAGGKPPARFLEELRRSGQQYNGFNLVFGGLEELYYYSNRAEWSGVLPAGIHVISNSLLNTPWPKVERSRRFFSRLALRARPDPRELLAMMGEVSEEEVQRDPQTSPRKIRELARHSIRIVFPRFGTRSSTAVVADRRGELRFAERSYGPEELREFAFRIR